MKKEVSVTTRWQKPIDVNTSSLSSNNHLGEALGDRNLVKVNRRMDNRAMGSHQNHLLVDLPRRMVAKADSGDNKASKSKVSMDSRISMLDNSLTEVSSHLWLHKGAKTNTSLHILLFSLNSHLGSNDHKFLNNNNNSLSSNKSLSNTNSTQCHLNSNLDSMGMASNRSSTSHISPSPSSSSSRTSRSNTADTNNNPNSNNMAVLKINISDLLLLHRHSSNHSISNNNMATEHLVLSRDTKRHSNSKCVEEVHRRSQTNRLQTWLRLGSGQPLDSLYCFVSRSDLPDIIRDVKGNSADVQMSRHFTITPPNQQPNSISKLVISLQ